MSVLVRLPLALVDSAKEHCKSQHRSIGSQIEHWSVIGKVAEKNPSFNLDEILKYMEDKNE
jgi:hypothetical protein